MPSFDFHNTTEEALVAAEQSGQLRSQYLRLLRELEACSYPSVRDKARAQLAKELPKSRTPDFGTLQQPPRRGVFEEPLVWASPLPLEPKKVAE